MPTMLTIPTMPIYNYQKNACLSVRVRFEQNIFFADQFWFGLIALQKLRFMLGSGSPE